MLKSWITYFLILVCVLVFKYFYIEYIPILFVAILLLLPVISIIYIVTGICSLKTEIQVEPKICAKNEKAVFKIAIKNRYVIPFPMLKIKYSIPNIDADKNEFKFKNLCLNSKQTLNLSQNVICVYTGIYESKLCYIELRDIFNFFRFRLKLKSTVKLSVVPRKLVLDDFENELFAHSQNYINLYSNSYSEMIGTRQYIYGDELKFIHWKNSAKLDEIVVKQFQAESESQILIALDLKKHFKNDCRKAADGIIESAISLCIKFINSQLLCDTIWYSERNNQVKFKTILSQTEFESFFEDIALERLYTSDISIQNFIDLNKKYFSIFVISSNLDLNLIGYLYNFIEYMDVNIVYFEVENIAKHNFEYIKECGIKLYHISNGDIVKAFFKNKLEE